MIKTLEEYNHKYGVSDSGDVVLLYRKVCNGSTVFYNPPKKMRKQKISSMFLHFITEE